MSSTAIARLEPVDAVEVTLLVDGSIDVLMSSTAVARRAPLRREWSNGPQLRAEHGYGLLVTIERGGDRSSVLYDCGLGRETLVHNADVLGVDLGELRAIVLSHGHADHHGGMQGLLRRLGRSHLPLILHPDAWRDRELRFPDVTIHMPPPSRADIEREGIEIREERGPTLLVDGALLVTGQVERTSGFEPGLPVQYARLHGTWERDAETWDDQGIVVNVRGKGLVVLSSCSHAGIINVLRNAKRASVVDHLHAFVGGLHLTGAIMEPLIPRTLDELAALRPDFLVPGHCTGWRAMHEVSRRFPSAYLQTSVGTRLRFEGQPA